MMTTFGREFPPCTNSDRLGEGWSSRVSMLISRLAALQAKARVVEKTNCSGRKA